MNLVRSDEPFCGLQIFNLYNIFRTVYAEKISYLLTFLSSSHYYLVLKWYVHTFTLSSYTLYELLVSDDFYCCTYDCAPTQFRNLVYFQVVLLAILCLLKQVRSNKHWYKLNKRPIKAVQFEKLAFVYLCCSVLVSQPFLTVHLNWWISNLWSLNLRIIAL